MQLPILIKLVDDTSNYNWDIFFKFANFLVPLFGIMVTGWYVKRTILAELKKQKEQVFLDKITDIPYELIKIIDEINNETKSKEMPKAFINLMNTLHAYGSTKIIKLTLETRRSDINPDDILPITILILVQLKLEITNTITCPDYFYIIKTKNYSEDEASRQKLIKINNRYVKKQKLNRGFLIKEKKQIFLNMFLSFVQFILKKIIKKQKKGKL